MSQELWALHAGMVGKRETTSWTKAGGCGERREEGAPSMQVAGQATGQRARVAQNPKEACPRPFPLPW